MVKLGFRFYFNLRTFGRNIVQLHNISQHKQSATPTDAGKKEYAFKNSSSDFEDNKKRRQDVKSFERASLLFKEIRYRDQAASS